MKTLETKEKLQIELQALNEAYLDACTRKDYRTCDILRAEIRRKLTGKPMLIRLETGLNLSEQDLFS